MALAFILINTEIGSEISVANKLKEFSFLKEIYVVYGIYDLIIKIEGDNLNYIKKVLIEKIRKIKEITSTITLIAHDDIMINEELPKIIYLKESKNKIKKISLDNPFNRN